MLVPALEITYLQYAGLKLSRSRVRYSPVLHFLSFNTEIFQYNVLGIFLARLPSNPRELCDTFHTMVDGLTIGQLTHHTRHLVCHILNRKHNKISNNTASVTCR